MRLSLYSVYMSTIRVIESFWLRVQRPVDEVEEYVRSRENDSGVLVYCMSVDPHVAVWARTYVTSDRIAFYGHLHQHHVLFYPVLLGYVVFPRGVDVRFAEGPGQRAGTGHVTGARQLQE